MPESPVTDRPGPAGEAAPIVVWSFSDGKPGHESQTRGLLAALGERVPLAEYPVPVPGRPASLLACLTGRMAFRTQLPDPDLLVGAGHATHLPMLGARRARGGRVVVLMKPSLPVAWFDLCVIPAHDRPRRAANILVTRGVLNRVRPGTVHEADRGLILVGGPSDHVHWSTADVVAGVRELLVRQPAVRWTLTTSRRTPADFTDVLGADRPDLAVVPGTQTAPDWLPEQLARAAQVWVTQDSVSMVYEALTSGAAVGLLDVPWRNAGDRLARGVQQLVQEGLVTTLDAWRGGADLRPPAEPFDEAARCAAWIAERWLDGR
jgi:hypothetical protein